MRLPYTNRRISENFVLTLFLAFTLILGAALRFYELGKDSLWIDEIITATDAQRSLSYILTYYNGSLLYTVLAHFSIGLNKSEFMARLPAAVFGILGIGAVYLAGRSLFGKKEGAIAAFLLAISRFHLRYSQEARGYADYMFFALLALFFLWQAFRRDEARLWLAFVLFTALGLWSHLFTLVVLLSESVFVGLLFLGRRFLGRREWPIRGKEVIKYGLSLITSLIIAIAPYIRALAFIYKRFTTFQAIGAAENLFSFFYVRDIFVTLLGVQLTLFSLIVLLMLVGWAASLRNGKEVALLSLLWVLIPFAFMHLASPSALFMKVSGRYLIPLLPMIYILAARGITALSQCGKQYIRRFIRWEGGGKLVLLILPGILGILSIEPIRAHYASTKEPWRELGAYLQEAVAPEDVVILEPGWIKTYLSYYAPRLHNLQSSWGDLHRFQALDSRHLRVWFVYMERSIDKTDLEGKIQNWVEKQKLPSIHVGWGIVLSFSDASLETASERTEKTIELLEEALRTFPPNPLLHEDLGKAYAAQGKWEEAIIQYEEAIRLWPDNASYYIFLGDAYKGKGDLATAMTQYEEALRLAPSYDTQAWFHLRLANAYQASGQIEQAIQEYERALALDHSLDQQAFFHTALGDAYRAAGALDEAIGHYEEAVALAPEEAFFRRLLGDAYLAGSRGEEAAGEYERALALKPELDQEVWFHLRLGKAYRESGRREEAIREYQRVLELEPNNTAAQRALDAFGE